MTRDFDDQSQDFIDEQLDQLITKAKQLIEAAGGAKTITQQQPQRSFPGKEPLCTIWKDVALRTRLFERITQAKKPVERNRARQKFIWVMQQSEIWRDPKDNEEVYQEALDRTWEWFGRNFDQYDPGEASAVTWFERTLKYRILDVYEEFKKDEERVKPLTDKAENHSSERQTSSPTEYVQAIELFEKIHAWIEKEKRNLHHKHVKDFPEANCHFLVLNRLPVWDEKLQQFVDNKDWVQIFQELKLFENEDEELKDKIQRCYRERCLPCLQKFLKSEGYSIPKKPPKQAKASLEKSQFTSNSSSLNQ